MALCEREKSLQSDTETRGLQPKGSGQVPLRSRAVLPVLSSLSALLGGHLPHCDTCICCSVALLHVSIQLMKKWGFNKEEMQKTLKEIQENFGQQAEVMKEETQKSLKNYRKAQTSK